MAPPLAGALTAILVLMCLRMLVEPVSQRKPWFYAAMGCVWGLAILAKVTPVILAPLLVGVIVVHGRITGASWRQWSLRSGLLFGSCFLISGWHFLRNWYELGAPFVSGWDPARGIIWWQDPSYRTLGQMTSFRYSLWRPILCTVDGLWDSLYSSLWLDGFLSGQVYHCPWNVDWLLAGAWLALVPTGLLLVSPSVLWRTDHPHARKAFLFAFLALAIYLAAIVDLYVRLPVFSTAKSTYAMGLLPCFGLLAAAGAAPLLQNRYLRALIFSAIVCWAVAAYLAYFCTAYYREGAQLAP